MRRLPVLAIVVSFMLLGGFAVCAQETPPEPAPAPAPKEPAPAPAPQAPAPAPALTPAPASAPEGPPAPVVKQVKIIIDNKAKSNGEIRFNFTPVGGPSKEVRVTVISGMSKKDICRDVAKELTLAVGSNYEVDHYDDDKVKVEAKSEAAFSLTLAAQTVSGISITLK